MAPTPPKDATGARTFADRFLRFARGARTVPHREPGRRPLSDERMHALLIHGAGGGGWEWSVWCRVFEAAGVSVHAPDLVPAPAGLAATRYGDYLVQVLAAVRSLPVPPVLVGASLGGLLALHAAAELPVAALVLVNPLPPAPWHVGLPSREVYPDIVRWGHEASLQGTRRALPDADDATCLHAWRRWRDESGAVLRHARGGVPLARPDCPLLLLASTADEDVPFAVSRQMAAAWDATLVHCEGASHVGPLLGRRAAADARLVLGWLRRTAG